MPLTCMRADWSTNACLYDLWKFLPGDNGRCRGMQTCLLSCLEWFQATLSPVYAFYHQGVGTYPYYVYVRLCLQPSDFIIVRYKQWRSFRSNKYSNKSWCIYFRAGTISKVLESDRWRKHKNLSHLNEDHLSPSIRSWTRISPPHSLSNQKTKDVVGEYPRL